MPSIDVTDKVRDRLKDLKKKLGIKNYSDLIHHLLFFYEVKNENKET